MIGTFNIDITRIKHSRIKEVNFEKLPFGKTFTDHMLIADYKEGEWQNPKIVPYGKMEVSPAMSALNYGQSIFEGMKVFKTANGKLSAFRAEDNYHRMNISADRMCMPAIPYDIFIEGLKALVNLDSEWVPSQENHSLYVRPVYFSTDEAIGVKPSETYRFAIVMCPVGPYFLEPLKVYAESEYGRSFEGGMGFAKAAGNYGGAFYPTRKAQQNGYHQIVWLDAKEHKYVEESGAMNLMIVINNTLITPKLSSSKLAGITRDSVLKLAKNQGIQVEERDVSIDEIISALEIGSLEEMFGCGTAVQIAPITLLGYQDKKYSLPAFKDDFISKKIGTLLSNIKTGKVQDTFNWNFYL